METENNFKHNEKMVFTEEEKLYHKATSTYHKYGKSCVNKVRDHCRGKYRGPACKICNLRYKQPNLFLLFSITALVMISIDYIVSSLNRIVIKEKYITYHYLLVGLRCLVLVVLNSKIVITS